MTFRPHSAVVDGPIVAYLSARDEILKRIDLREQGLRFYVTAVTAVFGLYFIVSPNMDQVLRPILLLIPPLCAVAASRMICSHNTMIGLLIYYCEVELSHHIMPRSENDTGTADIRKAKLWDGSEAHSMADEIMQGYGMNPYAAIIHAPIWFCAAVLMFSMKNISCMDETVCVYRSIYIAILVCLCAASYAITQHEFANTARIRKNIYRKIMPMKDTDGFKNELRTIDQHAPIFYRK